VTTLAEEMALWVARLRYEELGPQVLAKSKLILLDTIGCALGALEAVPVRLARQVVRGQGGNPQATPLGLGWKTSCEQAAFLNALALRYLDFNDYTLLGSHPSINVAPALSVAEAEGLSGKDLILGITVGYEVQLRLRETMAKGKKQGWDHSTAVHYAAAAVAGRLMGLPPPKLAYALAIAGSHASTLGEVRRERLSMWKGGAEPMGVRSGTFAALLARAGITGPLTILEGKHGFGKMVAGGLDEDLIRRRPEHLKILKSCIKVWPCLLVAQAPVAAALKIRSRGVRPEEIEKIAVSLSDFGYKQQRRFRKGGISTREDADHSVPYCVARAFLDGALSLDHFEEEALKDARVQALLRKISLQSDSSLPKTVGAKIRVRLRNGNACGAKVPYPPGHVQNPLSGDGLMRKFLALSESVLGRDRARQAAEMILEVDKLFDLSPLVRALSAAPNLDRSLSVE